MVPSRVLQGCSSSSLVGEGHDGEPARRSYRPRPSLRNRPTRRRVVGQFGLRHWGKLRAKRGASAAAARGVRECTLRAAAALATKYGEANDPVPAAAGRLRVEGLSSWPPAALGECMRAWTVDADDIRVAEDFDES